MTTPPEAGTSYTLGTMDHGAPCCEPQPLIEVRGLSVAYAGRTALQSVSLDIHRGCITALIGPSGCGKTTFLSVLNRLIDLEPAARATGDVTFDGLDVLSPDTDVVALRRRVGLVFQKPNPFPVSIRRNLELPLREHGIRDRERVAVKIETALRDVGLWAEVHDRLDAPALALSGGQQQRLCIARALVLAPDVLLMDEPCSALDPVASATVEALVASLRGRYTIVIVTHNLAQARRIANYAAFFWMTGPAGRLIEFGRCQRIFETPDDPLTAAYVSGARG